MAELIDKADENIINQLAIMYAVALTKYGVDIREKFETATQTTMAMNEAYLRGRQDEIEKFRVLQSGYESEIRAKAIDECIREIKEYAVMAYDWDMNDKCEEGKVGYIEEGLYEAVERLQMMKDEIADRLKGEQ